MSEPAGGVFDYAGAIAEMLPRAMGLQDFNPCSTTFGCCDRHFWQYKTVVSFPSGIYQQLSLPFALAAADPAIAGVQLRSEELLERAVAAMRFWAASRHASGAVDEWYRHEYSYCPTAFTTFGIAESLLLLQDRMTESDRSLCLEAVRTSCQWLARRFNGDVMNQNLAACCALWNGYLLTTDEDLRQAFHTKWNVTLEHFHSEGWFAEYGGADLGYATLALDLLACLHRRNCEADILSVAESTCRFLASFVTTSGELAGRLGSRGTDHTFPFGARYFSAYSESARVLANHFEDGHADRSLRLPRELDDRYFAYFYLPQFALAATMDKVSASTEQREPAGLPQSSEDWPEAGFRMRRLGETGLVISLRRQGAFNLSVKQHPVQHNLGYWVVTEAGERWTSGGWNADSLNLMKDQPDCWEIEGTFARVQDKLPLVRGSVPFHVLSEWFLRWERMAEWFQSWIKRQKISRRVTRPLEFFRRIEFMNSTLVITDRITKQPGCPIIREIGPVDDVEVHSPSAKYSGPTARIAIDRRDSREWVAQLERAGTLELRTIYSGSGNAGLVLESISLVPTPNESNASDRVGSRAAA